ncbi:MAG: hypothetical protein GF375_04270 [Candidatus Omnitrophica bacterium]|nr:hypothetical protein [Candidatus Omnitrophota bacterium]MBD3269260.1 hypothetical protein [Candidatus Omnitrophota bacterium]
MSILVEPRETYITTVREVSDTYLSIRTPVSGTAFLEVPRGTRVNIEVQVYNSMSGKVCFKSKIIYQEWARNRFINIACPRKLSWVQQRKFFRVETIMDAEFSLINRNNKSTSLDLGYPVLFTLIRNISEGGALLVIDRRILTDDFRDMDMIIRLKLPDNHIFRARARVAHIAKLAAEEKYGAGVEFINISRQDQEKIRKFVVAKSKTNYMV